MGDVFKRQGRREWFFKVKLADGRWQTRKGYTDKQSTRQEKARVEREVAQRSAGLFDRFAEHRVAAIAQHVAAFIDSLESNNDTTKHVSVTRRRLEHAVAGMGIARIDELDLSKAQAYLARLLKVEHRAAATRDHVAMVLKQFGAWAVDAGRLAENPLRHLTRVATQADKTRVRMPLNETQIGMLIDAAALRAVQNYKSAHPTAAAETLHAWRRQGEQRARLYLFAAYTGLRRDECTSLVWFDLDIAAPLPTVTVRAVNAKNSKTERVPLVPWVVAALREQHAAQVLALGRPVAGRDRVFHVANNLLEQLRKDAAFAGIGSKDEQGYVHDDEGRRLDFHSFRASCATLLRDRGVPQGIACRVMRLSDSKLLDRVYAQVVEADLHRWIGKLQAPEWAEQSDEVGGTRGPLAPPVAPNFGPVRAPAGTSGHGGTEVPGAQVAS